MTVFANGLEVACKAQQNKVIAAFPYVCMTPPQTPATPPGVPVPYPTFGLDGDTDKGTGTVKIGGETVTQKNLSYYTKCTGNEAGCAPMKNLISHVNTGKEYAHAWSGNVKMDSEPVSRFSDLSSNDHASPTSGGAPSVKIGAPGPPLYFKTDHCLVGSYKDTQGDCAKRGGQAHHIIPDEYLRKTSRELAEAAAKRVADTGRRDPTRLDDSFPRIDQGCCICVGGNANGASAREAKPTTKKGRQAKKRIQDQGKAHAETTGGKNLATMRCHGFLHQFDDRFRHLEPTVDNALETANKLLNEVVKYEQSAVTQACANKAKECIKKQFGPAKEKGAELKKIKPRSEQAVQKRIRKLRPPKRR